MPEGGRQIEETRKPLITTLRRNTRKDSQAFAKTAHGVFRTCKSAETAQSLVGAARMKTMKRLLLALVVLSAAQSRGGEAWEYHFQGSNSYIVAFTTDIRAYLELRSYEGTVLQSIDIYSPHSEPNIEATNIVGDATLEFLLRTNGGGTGLDVTDVRIFTFMNGRIHEIGGFVLEESDFGYPDESESRKVHGKLQYPRNGEVVYLAKEEHTKNGVTTTNSTVEAYVFDATTAALRKKMAAPTTTVRR